MWQQENDYEEVAQLACKIFREGAQETSFSSSTPIYKLPEELRKLKKSAYTPQLIAIGPLHRNNEHLRKSMQQVKLSYTNDLLCRVSKVREGQELAEQKNLTVLRECMEAIKASLDDAKKCYPEEVTLDAEMMLIDGCFILEFLYRLYVLVNQPWNFYAQMRRDPIFVNDSTFFGILKDLVLLENQIPFLVLEKLYELTPAPILKKMKLTDFVFLPLVDRMMRSKPEEQVPSEEVSSGNAKRYHHILHKIHDDYLPRDRKETGEVELSRVMPSASELVSAGVRFVPGTGNDLFKFKFTEPKGLCWWFRSARFEIPTLRIDETTEVLLRNLIAFERCPGISQHFTSYAIFMEMLMKSDIDVQVLEKAGVVHNWLGTSKVVTDLFNSLCRGVEIEEFLFADTCNRATMYNERSQATKNISDLKRQYCSSPWKSIGLCVAIIYFFITIAQLIVAIIK